MTTLPVEGRVFSRLSRFASLPQDLQQDTKAVQAILVQHKANVFDTHHTMLMQSVYCVKGKALIELIVKWLEERHMGAMLPGSDNRGAPGPSQPNFLAPARQIADALVLSGFLTPHTDDIKHMNAPPPDCYVDDYAMLVPVAKEITCLETTSVWSVLDGAIYAKFLKRKAGLLGPITSGKEVYVVLNAKTQRAYLFDSDLARESVAEIDAKCVSVELDGKSFEFGVRVASPSGDDVNFKPEEFNCGSKHLQEEFVNAWLNIGALYREVFQGDIQRAQSIYQFMDRDIHGNPVSFDKYRGKVLLVVNVASGCKMAYHNFPALTVLHEKYRNQGFEILAFPCNQFGGEEPRNHEEILQYLSQFNANYELFEKADVNGSHARPVFMFLKAKLPGTFGSFVKWNFTKFLVDRNGKPFKRFSPTDSPFELEQDIQELLKTQGNSQAQNQGMAQQQQGFAQDPMGARAPTNLNQYEGQQKFTQQSGFDKGQHASTHAPVYSNQFERQQGMPQQVGYGMGQQQSDYAKQTGGQQGLNQQSGYADQFEGQQGMPQQVGYGMGQQQSDYAKQTGGQQGLNQQSGYADQFEGQQGMPQQTGYANQIGGQQGMSQQSGYAGTQAQPQVNQFKQEHGMFQPNTPAMYGNEFEGQHDFSKREYSGTQAPHQAYSDEPHAP
uniref:Glutathione peroxidase n=1 Tax=Globisporangium ultimum (strain ATCC 200006 / CBS 805.95 / DAOM BR144) TaxID=431595 RepID=K3WJ90_GLOUD